MYSLTGGSSKDMGSQGYCVIEIIFWLRSSGGNADFEQKYLTTA
jgi:hypothetical protein